MENAIKKAIEGGWDTSPSYIVLKTKLSDVRLVTVREMDAWQEISNKYIETFALLDPFFWQALCGKEYTEWTKDIEGDFVDMMVAEKWKVQWHRFIDHLAEGKSPDEFFNQLLA